MKLPFKRKDTAEPAQTEALDQDLAVSDDPEHAQDKKRFKFKVSVQRILTDRKNKKAARAAEDSPDHVIAAISVEPQTGAQPPEASGQAPESQPEPEAEQSSKKIKKKKEKKPKEKKEKEPGKRKPVVAIAFGFGCVLATGTIATVIVLTGARGGQDLLATAAGYTTSSKFQKAEKIYNELLDEDGSLVAAHMGLADNYLAQGDIESAISILQIGYEATGDETIGERLNELRAQIGEEEAPRPEPIVWKDSALEAMVRAAMGFSSSEPITEENLANVRTLKIVGATHAAVNPASDETIRNLNSVNGYTIDGQLYTERGDIRTLDDLAHFKGLRKVTICYNRVSDISGLAGLTSLETVGLYFNEISDISALSSLSNLRFLYIYHNNISNLQPLSGLKSLRTLYIQNNAITDISPLKDTTGLVELAVSGNQISDISSLGGLDHLVFFFADNNQIQSLQVLAQLTSLTDISFSGNPITDYGPTRHVRNVNRK